MKIAFAQLALLMTISLGSVAGATESRFECIHSANQDSPLRPFVQNVKDRFVCYRSPRIDSEGAQNHFVMHFLNKSSQLISRSVHTVYMHCQTHDPVGSYFGYKAFPHDLDGMLSLRDAKHPRENGCILFAFEFGEKFVPGQTEMTIELPGSK